MSEGLLWKLREAFASRKPQRVAQRQRARLAEIVAFARVNSPYYRELYRDLPERVEDATFLPVTDKKKLMGRFDDWATDREVTIDKARGFAENPDLIGERFLGKYTLATTSGTTGRPGIFVLDDRSMAVTNAMALRTLRAWLGFGDLVRILARGGRMAMTIASGSHSPTAVAAARLHKSASGRKRVLAISVHAPLSEMVSQLNEFRPALLAPYASIARLLAGEQEAGRLNIRPVLMILAAEGLPISEYDRIAKVFGTKVQTSYAATECMFFSYGCEERWLHVNSDWAILEPVDADYRPVPPGEQSHTVLVSNLANRVQPILRYDLGDSVVQRPDPCPCGNPLPAIRVQGRTANALRLPAADGGQVSIPPLALELDHIPGVELSQVVQTTPTNLRVRLRPAIGSDPDSIWQAVQTEVSRLLAKHGLRNVTIERAEEAPEQSSGGKYRTVIPLS
jgi:phenylacetate-coenzyme A ligase PaaK-like adenylate-forming protein